MFKPLMFGEKCFENSTLQRMFVLNLGCGKKLHLYRSPFVLKVVQRPTLHKESKFFFPTGLSGTEVPKQKGKKEDKVSVSALCLA